MEQDVIHSNIWEEEAEADNPFAAAACYCSGYDVYGDILGKASWPEYLFLLCTGERATPEQAALLEGLAIALANPGPRAHSVRAAMNAGACGSTHASSLIAALAVGAGQYGGAHEVRLAMELWYASERNSQTWQKRFGALQAAKEVDIWPDIEHPPGFDPHAITCSTPVTQTLEYLATKCPGGTLDWLCNEQTTLEDLAGAPLTMTGVAAAAFCDLGFSTDTGEMLCLLLRLPGAAVHALEQQNYGYKRYPFFKEGLVLTDDPAEHAGALEAGQGGVR